MGLLWILILLGVGALAYFAIKGRMVRLREEFEQALRKATQGGRRSSLPSEDMVKCPACGTYNFGPVSGNPTCSIPEHSLPSINP